jgi:hypothetical protein
MADTAEAAPIARIADQTKVYGDPDPPFSGVAAIIAPLKRKVSTWGGDVLIDDTGKVSGTVTGVTRIAGENVGTYRYTALMVSPLSGPAAANYAAGASIAASARLTITPRPLAVTAVADTKRYDGTVHSATLPTVSGLRAGDRAVVSQSFDTAKIGTHKTLTPAVALSDGNGGANYLVILTACSGGVITASGDH